MSRPGLGPNYYKLWSATAISNLGDGVRWTALPLLAASLTRDPVLVAAVDFAAFLPWFLFALIAGALVDRLDRRMVMVFANAFRTAVMAVLGITVLAGEESLPLLYISGFLLGTAETMFDNAAQAILPSMVAKSELERANGRMYSAEIVMNQFAGPPLGGFLFATVAAVPFLLDAGSFAVAALLIFTIGGSFKTARPLDAPATKLRSEILEATRWLWNHRLLRALAIFLGLSNMIFTAAFSIFVLFALEILEVRAVGYGILLAAMAVGSLLGGLIGPAISRRTGGGIALIATLLLSGITLGVVGFSSNPVVVGAMFAVTGFVIIVWNVITVSLRQSIIPNRLLGRVNSAYRLLGWGTMPLGAALGGILGRAFGLRAPFLVGAGVYLAMSIVAVPLINNRAIAEARAEAEA